MCRPTTATVSLLLLLGIGLLGSGCDTSQDPSDGNDSPPTVPATPSGLVASSNDGAVRLSWDAAEDAATYRVYRSASPGSGASRPSLAKGLSSLSYTDASVENGTTYYYRVTAVSETGVESEASEAVKGTPLESMQVVEGAFSARVEAIHDDLPRQQSEGFTVPTEAEMKQWHTLVDTLVSGDTTAARSLIDANFSSYALVEFIDTETDQSYLLLQETPSVKTGWGTVALNLDPERNLAVEVPHPTYDLNTYAEGADVFQETGARVFIMAGTARCANRAESRCDGQTTVCDNVYHVSDMAHVVTSPYQVTHEVVTDAFPNMVALSLHGNGNSDCESVFLSSGVQEDTRPVVKDLRKALVERGVNATDPGTSSCPLVGSTNVQGRYTNGSPRPCTQAASSATGSFIHIEQQRSFRSSSSEYGALIEALNATFD